MAGQSSAGTDWAACHLESFVSEGLGDLNLHEFIQKDITWRAKVSPSITRSDIAPHDHEHHSTFRE